MDRQRVPQSCWHVQTQSATGTQASRLVVVHVTSSICKIFSSGERETKNSKYCTGLSLDDYMEIHATSLP